MVERDWLENVDPLNFECNVIDVISITKKTDFLGAINVMFHELLLYECTIITYLIYLIVSSIFAAKFLSCLLKKVQKNCTALTRMQNKEHCKLLTKGRSLPAIIDQVLQND